jgi:tripartite-type tricarboxylate transporter receptor subunit TctC
MADPAVVKILAEQQVAINALDTAALTELIKKDTEKWATVIKKAGIKIQ